MCYCGCIAALSHGPGSGEEYALMIQTLLSSSAKRWSLLTFCFWLRPVFFYLCVPCLLLSLILACFPRTYSSSISPCSHSSHLNNLLYVFTFCPKGLKLLSCHSFDTSLLPVFHPAFQVCAAASLALCPPVSASLPLYQLHVRWVSAHPVLIQISPDFTLLLHPFFSPWILPRLTDSHGLSSLLLALFYLAFLPNSPAKLPCLFLSIILPTHPSIPVFVLFQTFLRFPYSGSCFHRSTSISFQKAVKSISLT